MDLNYLIIYLNFYEQVKSEYNGCFTGIASNISELDSRKIVNFDEKRNSKGNSKYLVNTGVIILNNKIFKFIKKNQFVDLSNDVFKKIVNYKSIKFYGYQIEKKNSYCLAIDTPEAYKKLLKLIKNKIN